YQAYSTYLNLFAFNLNNTHSHTYKHTHTRISGSIKHDLPLCNKELFTSVKGRIKWSYPVIKLPLMSTHTHTHTHTCTQTSMSKHTHAHNHRRENKYKYTS